MSTNTTNEIQRMPRPLGFTALCQSQSSTQSSTHHKTEEKYSSKTIVLLARFLIREYVNNNYQILGKSISLENLQELTTMNRTNFLKEYFRIINASFNALKVDPQELIHGLLGRAISAQNSVLVGTENQTRLLLGSQGDGYKAFVSQAVNSAYQNQLKSSSQMLETALQLQREFGPKNHPVIAPNHMIQRQDGSYSEYQDMTTMTKEQALDLIQKNSQSTLSLPQSQKEDLFRQIGSEGVPNILASASNEDEVSLRIGQDRPPLDSQEMEPHNLRIKDLEVDGSKLIRPREQ